MRRDDDQVQEKVLLLGGSGFIGKNLQAKLTEYHVPFLSVDRTSYQQIDLAADSDDLVPFLEHSSKVMILASSVGFELFTHDPLEGYFNNQKILSNVVEAIIHASQKFNKSYDVMWFSSSEVYWSMDREDIIIDESTRVNLDTSCSRSLYMQVKALGETLFMTLHKFHPEIVKSVKVVRPFNISGKFQQRGLVYAMVKSALETGKITYADPMTRCITDVDYACNMIIDAMFSPGDVILNVCDKKNTLRLSTIARLICDILEESNVCKGIVLERVDSNECKFRSTSIPDIDLKASKEKLKKVVMEIVNEFK